eukprot:1254142-Rhodomonas_salina.2
MTRGAIAARACTHLAVVLGALVADGEGLDGVLAVRAAHKELHDRKPHLRRVHGPEKARHLFEDRVHGPHDVRQRVPVVAVPLHHHPALLCNPATLHQRRAL